MFGFGGTELLVLLAVLNIIVILPMHFSYKFGYFKGYLKALKDIQGQV